MKNCSDMKKRANPPLSLPPAWGEILSNKLDSIHNYDHDMFITQITTRGGGNLTSLLLMLMLRDYPSL